jgi:hypothetical protein
MMPFFVCGRFGGGLHKPRRAEGFVTPEAKAVCGRGPPGYLVNEFEGHHLQCRTELICDLRFTNTGFLGATMQLKKALTTDEHPSSVAAYCGGRADEHRWKTKLEAENRPADR